MPKIAKLMEYLGWLENTVLFYGKYVSVYKTATGQPYNLELIYLLATGFTFLLGFFLLVKKTNIILRCLNHQEEEILHNSGKGIKEGVMEKDTKLLQFSNKVLTGWDYCITEPKAVHHKHKNLAQELEADLENQRLQWKKERRTTQEKMKLYIIRFIINIIIVALLTGSLFLIYFTSTQLVELQKLLPYQHPLVKFTIQYLPSITITLLNVVVPVILRKLVLLEDYMPAFEIKMTLLRTVLLRLASLGVLLYSLYELIQLEDPSLMNKCGNKRWALNRNSSVENDEDTSIIFTFQCWETYVGQQIYKLIILDFLVFTIVTFVVEFPRRFIYDRFKRVKMIKMVGLQEFNLPKAVLDIVYSQTLCWMGFLIIIFVKLPPGDNHMVVKTY
ncbi:hypothetical protein KUTeg_003184 [Tegillarca granosa]|uniref:TMC domain-containing protein n=1 Tax=Tegillarca granosa TaxID=220873 RepID=A0ABQ9FLE5_TEGGR|nr:hypothetical protein KUTeg_003184 [Tegillarca granosa]